jgi:hypothetical protein
VLYSYRDLHHTNTPLKLTVIFNTCFCHLNSLFMPLYFMPPLGLVSPTQVSFMAMFQMFQGVPWTPKHNHGSAFSILLCHVHHLVTNAFSSYHLSPRPPGSPWSTPCMYVCMYVRNFGFRPLLQSLPSRACYENV